MGKLLLAIFCMTAPLAAQAGTLFVTSCHQGACLTDGWTTTDLVRGYHLEALCTGGDCQYAGWSSTDTDGSHFEVRCKPLGCFIEGWTSVETVRGMTFYDDVLCRNGACLVSGWDVHTNYDRGGGVSCINSDCAHEGGVSFWRGRDSRTTCHEHDCYRAGWDLEVY